MTKKIKVLVYKVGLPPILTEIDNTLEASQEVVEGYIEGWAVPNFPSLMVICHSTGRYTKEANRVIPNLDLVYGTFFIVRIDDEGENVSLTERDIQRLLKEIP